METPHAPPPRVVWLARSFRDYRVPVFAALHGRLQGGLRVVCAEREVPAATLKQAQAVLGDALIPLRGEWRLGAEDRHFMANRNISLCFQPGLLRLLKQLAPDVVIGDGFFKWTTAGVCHRLLRGTPLVIAYERTAHTERHAQWFRTWYRRRVVRVTAAMACAGSLCRAYTEGLGMPAHRIVEGHMVADVPRFMAESVRGTAADRQAWRAQWGSPDVLALCVGRLVPGKGCQELLRAWAAMDPRLRERAALLFVGEGPLEATLRADAEARGLRSVKFAGAVPHAALAPCYAHADLLVMPTLEDNWSLVVPEAMACGLPVLCSRHNGCHPELVQPGRNGWICDPLVPEAFAEQLSRVLAAPAALPSMGVASREIVAACTPVRAAESLWRACLLAREVRV